MRFRNIEFRWSNCNQKYELVKWNTPTEDSFFKDPTCYDVAFFDKGKEGFNMRTVGDRFFEDKDAWVVSKYALGFLNAIFDLEKEEEELK
jgi:hypothetical protein